MTSSCLVGAIPKLSLFEKEIETEIQRVKETEKVREEENGNTTTWDESREIRKIKFCFRKGNGCWFLSALIPRSISFMLFSFFLCNLN